MGGIILEEGDEGGWRGGVWCQKRGEGGGVFVQELRKQTQDPWHNLSFLFLPILI